MSSGTAGQSCRGALRSSFSGIYQRSVVSTASLLALGISGSWAGAARNVPAATLQLSAGDCLAEAGPGLESRVLTGIWGMARSCGKTQGLGSGLESQLCPSFLHLESRGDGVSWGAAKTGILSHKQRFVFFCTEALCREQYLAGLKQTANTCY